MGHGDMKKLILIGLIAVICFILLLIAVGCIRLIHSGWNIEIAYPKPNAVVPTEFSVLAVAAKWSSGIETNTPLFLGTTQARVKLEPVPVQITLDGVPYDRSDSGDHHVFLITARPGDHTVGLTTPEGTEKITVHVTEKPPIAVTPFPEADEYARSVGALKMALYNFEAASPVLSFSADVAPCPFDRIFLIGDGAFILFGSQNDGKTIMTVGEVRYVAPVDGNTTADDIAAAPVVFTWDSARHERPVRVSGLGSADDRLYVTVFDDTTLTVFSIFPDGRVDRSEIALSVISPTLAESVQKTPYPQIAMWTDRNLLTIHLAMYRGDPAQEFFDIRFRDGVVEAADRVEEKAGAPTTVENPLTHDPTSFSGPTGTPVIAEIEPTGYLPLPTKYAPFSFTAGSLHSATGFYREQPRFEIGPLIPSIGNYHGVGGDVTFGKYILRSSIGGYEEYFRITP
jgi:hypothetical protein